MSKRMLLLAGLLVIAIVVLIGVGFTAGRRSIDPANHTNATTPPPEQLNAIDKGDHPVQPDLNTQEFILNGSNVSCSTTEVNGVKANSCNGSVTVVPRAQADMEPKIYKINENTKLMHNGQAQDIMSLQQLSQAQTTVKIKLADNSQDTLVEINY